ncbi:uncharacterized protein BT62DRAFT_918050 [Guyanagaster necrorhizus]|uniref:Prolyl 4-hydroxylase alpha subunit Fe(2+) 2OG dioxygenase domain-containing protein n=1 Tax=Guyanagaster necrorhizus TaxID=856835 RepID=A0A9P7VWX0_9AGAR|nr:uncharacterized protein BT62DRAFT_918050 [Guyanagaster necrorhizus MCA 3950]KAG7448412.1 hypothetical protein BT62DRAFT_918050 [Guyanagaster necrorhizus MCA 3950]
MMILPSSTPCSSDHDSLNFSATTQGDLARLHKACDPAPFGRSNETVLDEIYRRAQKLDLSVESYKLNVYGEGALFKAHKDTPRAPNMFGSLVLVFPTPHMDTKKDFESYTFDTGTILANSPPTSPSIAYVTFYSGVEHEVLLVISRARITLTYNLYFEQAPRFFGVPDAKHTILRDSLKRLMEDETFLPDGGCLGFGLRHQYQLGHDGSVQSLAGNFEGSDAAIYSACTELGLNVMLQVLHKEENGERLFLSREGPSFDLEVEDIDDAMAESMDVVQEEYGEGMVWVTDAGQNLNVVAYGNEASLAYIYGDVCLLVEWEKRN